MSHLPKNDWHGHVGQNRRFEIPIESPLAFNQIQSAELRIWGQAAIPMDIQAWSGGYLVVADPVPMPPIPDQFAVHVEASDVAGNGPVTVAEGILRVSPRVQVAA